MKILPSVPRLGLLAATLAGALLTSSCSNPSQTQPAAPAPQPSEIGRFQVAVVNEGDRGVFVLLLDTKEGATWIYRPPQGPVFNGFWSDIPRLTNPAETWRQAFQQLMGPQQAVPPAGGTLPQPTTGVATGAPPRR
jgi:hypothetical protein